MNGAPSVPKGPPWAQAVLGIESASWLDGIGKAIGAKVRSLVPAGDVKDALAGTWLGHAVHPMLTDLVIGSFVSATLLDLFGGQGAEPASERLIMTGIAAYGPTALTGINDWADTEIADERVRRAGLVHASTNAVALGLFSSSLVARRQGGRARAAVLSSVGSAVLMAGGYLGGHLSLRRGVGPDQTVFDPGPTDWTPATEASTLQERMPMRVVVDETPVLLVKDGERHFALHDRCSHRGCSLSNGQVEGEEIVCACHGSRFDLRSGAIRGGPASSPQPAFEVREHEGRLEVRRLAVAAV